LKNYSYPPEVHVGGHVFMVKLVDAYATDTRSPSLVGETSIEEADIIIALRTANGGYKHINEVDCTMCHEITHQINNIWNIGLDEHQVDSMAQGWMQALHDMGINLIRER
jgi:hypothetical protein